MSPKESEKHHESSPNNYTRQVRESPHYENKMKEINNSVIISDYNYNYIVNL